MSISDELLGWAMCMADDAWNGILDSSYLPVSDSQEAFEKEREVIMQHLEKAFVRIGQDLGWPKPVKAEAESAGG